MSTILRTHWSAVALAIVVASLTAFPQLIAEKRMGGQFQGVHPLVIDDQIYYLARAHETLDGHPTLGNPYLAEHKDTPGVQFWIPDMVLAQISEVLGGLHNGAIAFDFVFPFLIVLLSYLILFKLTGDKLLSLVFAAWLDPGITYLPFLRTPNPQLFVLMLLAYLFLMQITERANIWWTVVATLLGGILFYVYPFYWTYFLATVGFAGAASFVLVRETRIYKKLFAVVFGSIILGIPYFLESYKASKLSFYKESLHRIGVLETHFPSGFFILALIGASLALIAWCWWKNLLPHTPLTVFVASAVGAGALAVNQHIITGMNFFFTVHYTTFVQFMSVFALGLCLPPLVRTYVSASYFETARRSLLSLIVLLTVWHAAPQALALATPKPADIEAQRYGPVLSWLDVNTKTDDVIYADPQLSLYIPAYTRDNVYFAPYAYISYLTDEEVYARYIGSHYLDPTFTREDVIASNIDVFGLYYLAEYQHISQRNRLFLLTGFAPLPVSPYPEEEIQKILLLGTEIRKGNFDSAISPYRVDYIVWDSIKDPQWRIGTLPSYSRKVYESNGLIVYQL